MTLEASRTSLIRAALLKHRNEPLFHRGEDNATRRRSATAKMIDSTRKDSDGRKRQVDPRGLSRNGPRISSGGEVTLQGYSSRAGWAAGVPMSTLPRQPLVRGGDAAIIDPEALTSPLGGQPSACWAGSRSLSGSQLTRAHSATLHTAPPSAPRHAPHHATLSTAPRSAPRHARHPAFRCSRTVALIKGFI